MVWWCPSVRVSVRPSVRHSFPHFSPTCFEILSWNFVYHFILMHVRLSSSTINFRQFLLKLCPFWTSHAYKYAVFCTFLIYMLWHIELKFCIWLCFTLLQIKFECREFASIFVGVTPLLELRIPEIHSFPHFFLTSFDILSWNFSYDFVLLYYSSSLSIINLRQFLWELCPFWNLKYWKYTVFALFCYMLWYIELKFCIWLYFFWLQIKFECRQFASIFVGVMPLLELTILEIHSFLLFFSYILWYIELKLYIWLCLTVLQIKFECR